MPVYLDHAATTPVDARVAACMARCLTRDGAFGNPASGSHAFGAAAHAVVERARAQVAAAVGAVPEDIVWTSGATEANNLALFGAAQHYRDLGRHIITARTEHKAVLDPCRELQRRGWHVTYLEPRSDGLIDPERVAAALRPDTVLVSIMHVNNELGVYQDVPAIAAACARHGVARLHVDAAQSVGKLPLHFTDWGIDLMSLSAHKAYGPKGVGALAVSRRRGVQLQPLQLGGGQERNLRSGTVATHQVAGMGAAFELAAALCAAEAPRMRQLRDRLWDGFRTLPGVWRNGDARHSVPHILNLSFDGVDGESLIAAVRPRIAVSTGSACTSANAEPSYVLRALGRSEQLAESSLRFSIGRGTTLADVETAAGTVTGAVAWLRGLGGRGAVQPAAAPASVPAGPLGTESSDYNNLTQAHFAAPVHAGVLTGTGVQRGAAGGPVQGAWVQFDVRLCESPEGPRIDAVRFLASGCPHVIAAADWVAERQVGRTARPDLPVSVHALRDLLGAPVTKLGRLLVVEDAWIAAISSPYHG